MAEIEEVLPYGNSTVPIYLPDAKIVKHMLLCTAWDLEFLSNKAFSQQTFIPCLIVIGVENS